MSTTNTGPAGPSTSLRQVYNQVPFVNAPFISQTRNTKMARGMIVPVTVNANTAITITHNLGRLVQGMLCISNGTNGELFTAGLARVITGSPVRTKTQQTIQANLALTNALIWVF